MVEIHVEWLKAAHDDLILLSEIQHNEHITNMIAFHAQQAVEKTLKSLLEYRGKEVRKIHKIQSLMDMTELNFDDYDDLIQLLDSLYIDSRYPGDMGLLPYGKPTLDEAKKFYEFALSVFDKVCDILDIDKKEIVE